MSTRQAAGRVPTPVDDSSDSDDSIDFYCKKCTKFKSDASGAAATGCDHKWKLFQKKKAPSGPPEGSPSGAGPSKKRDRDDNSSSTTSITSRHKVPLDHSVEDPLEYVLEVPIDPAKAAKMVESGSLCWLGDIENFPELLSQRKADDPNLILVNAETFDQIMSIRLLAQALYSNEGRYEAAAGEEVKEDIRTTADANRDIPLANTIYGHRSTARSSPLQCVETAFVKSVSALGAKARRLRTAHILRTTKLDETTEVKVRDPKNPKQFIDYIRYGDSQSAVDRIGDVGRLYREPVWMDIDSAKGSADFMIGIEVAAAGFDPASSLRDLWRAVDEADGRLRDAVKKAKPDDAKAAKQAAKDAKDEARRKEDGAVAARAIASALTSPRGRGGPAASAAGASAASASLDSSFSASAAGASAPAPGAGKRPRRDGGPGKPGGDSAVPDLAAVMALPANKRTARMCRRHKLCMKCREGGHMAAACTNVEVKVDP